MLTYQRHEIFKTLDLILKVWYLQFWHISSCYLFRTLLKYCIKKVEYVRMHSSNKLDETNIFFVTPLNYNNES